MAVNMGRRTLGLVLAAGAIAAAGGWWALRPGTQVVPPQMPEPGAGALPGVDLHNVPELVLGNPDAKVTVTEYASYTCPHCATFHRDVFKPLLRDYIEPGRIRFVYREVFFDRFGLWAAMVARCGGEERYFGIADLLYAGQSDWAGSNDPVVAIERLRRIGRTAGLTDDQLTACLEDAEMAQAMVATYNANSAADGITATPSLVINGQKHSNMNYAALRQIIDAALAE